MTPPEDGQQLEFRLRTGRELFDALRSPDVALRLATLRAVADRPEKALAFGAEDGGDVIDELIGMVRNEPPSLVRTAAAAALFSFDDPRSLEEARAVFRSEDDLEVLMMAGNRIAREADSVAVEHLLPHLSGEGGTARRRTAARLLAGRSGLGPGEGLRVHLLAGETGIEPPPLSVGTLHLWIAELCGDLRTEARGALMACGREAFLVLKDNWPVLDASTRGWLVSWGAASFRKENEDLVRAALSEGDYDLRLAALEAVARYAEPRVFDEALRNISVNVSDSRWAVAAIRAGAPVEDIRDRVFAEEDMDIRVAMIARFGRDGGPAEILERLLGDDDWRVRAAATEALCARGEAAVDVALRLMNSDDVAARTAAAQILLRLGTSEHRKDPDLS